MHGFRGGRNLIGGLAAVAILLIAPAAASANSYPVTNTNDTGVGSLRGAIFSANSHAGPDTIPISANGTVTLQSALPAINQDVDIIGPGSTKFTINGADQHRGFVINVGVAASISDITISHAACDGSPCAEGAGIQNDGVLTLNRSVVTQNTVTLSGVADSFPRGAGILNSTGATLHVVRSKVSHNTSDSEGGTNQNAPSGAALVNFGTATIDRSTLDSNQAIAHAAPGATTNVFGGAIANDGPLTITRSTISNNTASANDSTIHNSAQGGGIANSNDPMNVDVTIARSTVANNVATSSGPPGSTNGSQGGGMESFGGTLEVQSSTFAHNSAAAGGNLLIGGNLTMRSSIASDANVGDSCVGTTTSDGYNISDDGTCGFSQPTDQNADPMLAASLGANGGPTKTYALLLGSPAIDKGRTPMGETTDQRGKPRPHDFSNIANASGGDGADIGAFEAQPSNTIIDTGPSGTTNDPTPTFTFHATEAGATLQCRIDAQSFAACTSPRTVAHLDDGAHTLQVRAKDAAGNPDNTPASRSFTVKTAEVKVSGSTLVVTGVGSAKDNFRLSLPAPGTLRVTDAPSGSFTGSGVHVGPGCTRTGDYIANCDAAGVSLLKVTAASATDKVTNLTSLPSTLLGGAANDVLVGGSANDSLDGGAGADSFKGMNGNDKLLAHDLASDTLINCDGGSTPGAADKADLDLLPKDPDAIVHGCETKTRHP